MDLKIDNLEKLEVEVARLEEEYAALLKSGKVNGKRVSTAIFQFMKDNKDIFKIEKMAEVLKVSRSGYYAWLKRPESKRARLNRKLLSEIKELHRASNGEFGAIRIHRALKEKGLLCCRSQVTKLMNKHNIKANQKGNKKKDEV